MTQQASAPAPAASPDNGTGVSIVTTTLEERAAAAFGQSDPAAEVGNPALPDASAAGSDEGAKARAERRAKLDQLRLEERGRVDAMAAHRERDELRQKLAALEAQSKTYEGRVDPAALTDPAQFFALAEKAGADPTKLYEWMRERMANPELAAATAAQRAVDPKLSALEKQIAEQKTMIDTFMQAQKSARDAAEEAEASREFVAFTSENAAIAPHSASFLREHGEEEFLKLALRAVQDVPAHGGAQAILDEIEENLTQLGRIYRPQGEHQRRQATPSSHYAAAQAPTTVSNTLAQQRSSVVDDDQDWSALPYDERAARLFR